MSLTCELVVKVDELRIMDLFQEVLKLAGAFASTLFDLFQDFVDDVGILSNAELLELVGDLGFGQILQPVHHLNDILESLREILLRLLVFSAQFLETLLDLLFECFLVEVLRVEVGFDRAVQDFEEEMFFVDRG